MVKWKRVLGAGALALVLLLLIAVTLTVGWRPFIGPRARAVTDRRFASSPERLARGKYLVESIVGCVGCPRAGRAGRVLQHHAGPVGHLVLRRGALPRSDPHRQGRARPINGVMPWLHYRGMTDEDLKAVFANLRTLTKVRHAVDNSLPPTDCKRCGNRHGGGERNGAA